MKHLSRRSFLAVAGSAALLGLSGARAAPTSRRFRIRTINAGIEVDSVADLERFRDVLALLSRVKAQYEADGYEVQTVRIATQPMHVYVPDWPAGRALPAIVELDRLAEEHRVSLALGPIVTSDEHRPELAQWASELVHTTKQTNFSVAVASAESGIHRKAIRTGAETIGTPLE